MRCHRRRDVGRPRWRSRHRPQDRCPSGIPHAAWRCPNPVGPYSVPECGSISRTFPSERSEDERFRQHRGEACLDGSAQTLPHVAEQSSCRRPPTSAFPGLFDSFSSRYNRNIPIADRRSVKSRRWIGSPAGWLGGAIMAGGRGGWFTIWFIGLEIGRCTGAIQCSQARRQPTAGAMRWPKSTAA